jgi:hypothetical protein
MLAASCDALWCDDDITASGVLRLVTSCVCERERERERERE